MSEMREHEQISAMTDTTHVQNSEDIAGNSGAAPTEGTVEACSVAGSAVVAAVSRGRVEAPYSVAARTGVVS